MDVSVTYYRNGCAVTETGAWNSMADTNVLWVNLTHHGNTHTLLGADYYWIEGTSYGMEFDPIHGQQFAAWKLSDNGVDYLGDVPPPDGAYILSGIEVSDELWRKLAEERRA